MDDARTISLARASDADDAGLLPTVEILHDCEPFDGPQPFELGIVAGSGVVTIEAVPNVEDLAGHGGSRSSRSTRPTLASSVGAASRGRG